MKARDYRFDLLKAFVMFCVVFWHVLRTERIAIESHSAIFQKAIVGFNMALFFAASGYFSGRSARQAWPLGLFGLIVLSLVVWSVCHLFVASLKRTARVDKVVLG